MHIVIEERPPSTAPPSSRRKRVARLAALAALTTGVVVPSAMQLYGNPSFQPLQQAQNFMSLMEQRSPGVRTVADMIKKALSPAASAESPRQRALGKIRVPEVPAALGNVIFPPEAPLEIAMLDLLPLPPGAPPLEFGPPGSVGPPFSPPPSGGVPPALPPGSPGPPGPPGAPPTVPEPATWLMMLLGFGFVGARLRRRSQRQVLGIG